MISWCLKYWKLGIPLLLIPIALLIRFFGSLGGLLRLNPSGTAPPAVHHDPEASERERERIRDHREEADKAIVTEADRERKDIDKWLGQ